MKEYIPDIVIYHNPCSDGFAAAWACWRRWGDAPEYFATNYGKPPPDVAGKHVLIVDFSYKQPVIAEMARHARSIVILDHHESAERELEPYACSTCLWHGEVSEMLEECDRPEGSCVVIASFDMARSGARMAWDFCHETEAPLLIKYVEDRDLWLFKYKETKAFSLMLKTKPEDFGTWDWLNENLSDDMLLVANGMLQYQESLVRSIAAKAHWVVRDNHRFMAVNCPYELSSEVGNRILEDNAETPFAATWNDGPTHRGWSLRSTAERQNVSLVAVDYGGGGHRNAAGFSELLIKH